MEALCFFQVWLLFWKAMLICLTSVCAGQIWDLLYCLETSFRFVRILPNGMDSFVWALLDFDLDNPVIEILLNYDVVQLVALLNYVELSVREIKETLLHCLFSQLKFNLKIKNTCDVWVLIFWLAPFLQEQLPVAFDQTQYSICA